VRRSAVAGALGTVVLIAGCQTRAPSAGEPPDSRLLVDTLLGIETPAFVANGSYDGLRAVQAWHELYARAAAGARQQPDPGNERLKTFLLVGFIAHAQHMAATAESFIPDLMGVYQLRREDVLTALVDSPVLTPTTCHYLGRFFGFEDRNAGGKAMFLTSERPALERRLPPRDAAACIDEIERAES
jgi:hypothetical protein